MKYIDILKQHTQITKVEIEPTKHAKDFWSRLIRDVWRVHNDYALYESMSLFSVNDSLELVNKQGRLLRRLSAYHKSRTKQSMSDQVAGIVGDKLQYYISNSGLYHIDFTDEIDWRDGQFGKDDSCWWSCYVDSIPTFEKAGGWAIRFYSDNNQDDDNGIGRTWVVPTDNSLVCFNSYGIERPIVSKVIKAVFATHGIELHYKTASISNSESETIPYINDGSGFVLSESEDCDDNVVLCMPKIRMKVCATCGNLIRKDAQETRGNCYCKSCFSKHFQPCEVCGVPEHLVLRHTFEGKSTCERCLRDTGARCCEKCNNWTRDHVEAVEYRSTICKTCASFHCEKCNRYYMHRESCPCVYREMEYARIREMFEPITDTFRFSGYAYRVRRVYQHKTMPRLNVFKSHNKWLIFSATAFVSSYETRDEAMRFADMLATESTAIPVWELSNYHFNLVRRLERENAW